jgi:hypothetical protein
LVDGRESATADGSHPITHLEAARRPYPVHATSPARSGFRGFVRRSKHPYAHDSTYAPAP